MADPWPVRLVFKAKERCLQISFDTGEEGRIPYTVLRAESPSAEVQGHGGGPKPPQSPIPDDIAVKRAEPVGRYAIRPVFSDGHDSGLYTWGLLYKLATS